MQDITAHIGAVVRGELAQHALANGMDKDETYWSVSGGGMVGPVIADGEIIDFAPTWSFVIGVRNPLLGQPVLSIAGPIHSVHPNDDEVKQIVARLFAKVYSVRVQAGKVPLNG